MCYTWTHHRFFARLSKVLFFIFFKGKLKVFSIKSFPTLYSHGTMKHSLLLSFLYLNLKNEYPPSQNEKSGLSEGRKETREEREREVEIESARPAFPHLNRNPNWSENHSLSKSSRALTYLPPANISFFLFCLPLAYSLSVLLWRNSLMDGQEAALEVDPSNYSTRSPFQAGTASGFFYDSYLSFSLFRAVIWSSILCFLQERKTRSREVDLE